MAEKPNDILCRRVPIAMLDKQTGLKLIPETCEILAKERKWNSTQKKKEEEEAIKMLDFMK
jgi:glycerol-3-phosphate dehydrogenase